MADLYDVEVEPEVRAWIHTVFVESRQREATEVERAHQAQQICEQKHPAAHQTYQRKVN